MKPGALSSNRKQCSFAPISSPSGSLVKVESIFIDIVAAEQVKPKKCEHFTIRGFVSDSHEQNDKLCSPLFVCADAAGSREINSTLYPLHTPHFKSWQCQNCLNDIDATAGKKGSHNILVSCSKQLKAKCFRSQRSLENVVAYLSEKLKQTSELGKGRSRALSQGVKVTSKFKQKHKQKQKWKQKQKLHSALNSNTRGLEENELHNAATGFILNRQDSLTCVDEHQATSSKFIILDGSQHKSRLGAASKQLQQHDDSIGSRKNKAKKVRLLNEIFEKDARGAQPAMTKTFPTDDPAKASCSASQSLQKIKFDNVRCQTGQKRNNNGQEQDRSCSQMQHANTVEGNRNCETRKGQGLNNTIANELHATSNGGWGNPVIEQADKMFSGRKQKVDRCKNYPYRSQDTNKNSCPGQEQLSKCQPFHGRIADPLHNNDSISMPYSQFKGKSNDGIPKVHAGENFLVPTDNGGGLEENNVKQKHMETIQIGQAECFQHTQYGNSSRKHYPFTEGFLEPRKRTGGWFPGSQNGNLSIDTRVYMGESSSAYKSYADKNLQQGTNTISALKRPKSGPYGDRKKSKHSRSSEGDPTVGHQTELLLRNCQKKMSRMIRNPESSLGEIRGNLRQEVGTSDDIPMEIVELMAKNQYERHLHEVGDNHYEQQSGSYGKKDLGVRTSMVPNDVFQRALHKKPHSLSASIYSEVNMGISIGQPSVTILQRPTGNTYRPLISSQRELSGVLPFPATDSRKADIFQIQNSKYDMNKLASEQRVPSRSQGQFELWQPTSQKSDSIDRPWPMAPPNNSIHMTTCVFQGNASQSFNFEEVPKCTSRSFGNSSMAGKKTNNLRPEASHISLPIRVDSKPHMSGSPDPYANDAIPAMNLLSLMNGRPQSSNPIHMDDVANRKTLDRTFSNDHLAMELSGNSFASKSGHKLKRPSPYGYKSKNLQSDASCQCSPPVPTFNSTAAASLHGNVANNRDVQLLPLSRYQERVVFSNVNPCGSLLLDENKSIMYQQSPLTSNVGVAFQRLVPAHELANHIFSHPWSVPGSSPLFMNGNFSGYHNLVTNARFKTLDEQAEREVCCLNRNPMEFSTPGPGNEFMISPEELKLRRKTYLPKFTRPMATSSFKQQQQGFIKYTAPNNRL